MRQVLAIAAVVWCGGGAVFAQDSIAKTFDHYEAIRVALAADTVKGIAEHAAALAPLAGESAGADAKTAAEQLATSADLTSARQHFGVLSAALLPALEKAKLDNVYFYTCSMVKQSWAQRGQAIENPYMGKGMLTCGVAAKPSK